MSDPKPFVHVVMACWNRLAATRQTVPALLDLTDYPDWAVTVVDDASADGTRAWLHAEKVARDADTRRGFDLIAHKRQLGTNVSHNEAWARRPGWYCKLDNNALVVNPGWLAALVDLALALGDAHAGIVAHDLEVRRRVANAYPITVVNGVEVIERTAANVAGKCALLPSWSREAVGYWNTNVGTLYRGADRLMALRLCMVGLGSFYHPKRGMVRRLDGEDAGETAQTRAFRRANTKRSIPGVQRLMDAYCDGRLEPNDWRTPVGPRHRRAHP